MFKDESSLKMKLGILETWDNGPVGKATAIQAWEPGFDPQYLCKKPTQGHTLTLQHRQNSCRRISEVCGLASVAEYMNSRVTNRTNQRKASEEDAWISTSRLHTHPLMCAHNISTCESTHMHKHAPASNIQRENGSTRCQQYFLLLSSSKYLFLGTICQIARKQKKSAALQNLPHSQVDTS